MESMERMVSGGNGLGSDVSRVDAGVPGGEGVVGDEEVEAAVGEQAEGVSDPDAVRISGGEAGCGFRRQGGGDEADASAVGGAGADEAMDAGLVLGGEEIDLVKEKVGVGEAEGGGEHVEGIAGRNAHHEVDGGDEDGNGNDAGGVV